MGLVLVLLLGSLTGPARAGDEPFRIDDLLRYRTTGGLDLSPDGTWAVTAVRSMVEVGKDGDRIDHGMRSHLWWIPVAGEASAEPRQLTWGDRQDGGAAISPDGRKIAFVRQHGEGPEARPQIWILPLEGGEAFPVTDLPHGAFDPRWSPDGETLLVSTSIPEAALRPEAGQPPWTSERPGRTPGDAPDWAARRARERMGGDGDEGSSKGSEEPAPDRGEAPTEPDPGGDLAELRSFLARNAAQGDPRVFDRLHVQGELDLSGGLSFRHLVLVPAERPEDHADERTGSEGSDGAPGTVQLTRSSHPYQSFDGCSWSPDGRWIACSSVTPDQHPDRIQDGDLWLVPAPVSVPSGEESPPPPRLLLDWEGWTLAGGLWSPDGRTLAFGASDQSEPGYQEIRVAALDLEDGRASGPPRLLTDQASLDRSITDARWSPDGRHLYLVAPDRGAVPLLRIPREGAASGAGVEVLVGDPTSARPRGIHAFDLAPGRLVYAATEVASPWELYAAGPDGEGERVLTDLNRSWVATKRVVQPEERWIDRPDGHRVQAWTMEPAFRRPGARYPLALEIHGGPSAMWGPGEDTMWLEFQLLTSWGYGVVYSNPRGSGGYGFDFLKANYQDWGPGPAGDILAAVDSVTTGDRALDWVDPDQLVVTGGSYAGYMTAWIVTQDHRFRAAVAQRGVYDLAFFFGEGNAWQLVPRHLGGYPWQPEIRTVLEANSPLTFVDRVETPLLILHADLDLRTGVTQSEALYKSLKVQGKPVEYVRYPDEGHDLSRTGDPDRRMDRLGRIIEFFERYVTHPPR